MSGGCARTFTTIITDANATMTQRHDRMPTILESSDGAEHDLATLLRPSGNVRWVDVGSVCGDGHAFGQAIRRMLSRMS
jgi:putative SOS response-associated peptidase YedK